MRIGLIPVKELVQAKARLATALDDQDRRELALALYRDVLAATLACPALDAVAVTSRDREALSLAAEAGATALVESGGLNEALTSASQELAERGATRVVVLAADLPFADPASIATVAQADAEIVIVPSRDGGTNALALPPGAIDFRFGSESARRHKEAAHAAGLRSQRLELPALAFDIDTPDDLRRLRETLDAGPAVGRHTLATFERWQIAAGDRA